jgi:hypothetical protein
MKYTRHQILLSPGQLERLNTIYQTKSASEVIRELVRQHLVQVEQKLRERKENV